MSKAAVQADRAWIREHLGFITDRHQICVGITRAKHGLVIVGKHIHGHMQSHYIVLFYINLSGNSFFIHLLFPKLLIFF